MYWAVAALVGIGSTPGHVLEKKRHKLSDQRKRVSKQHT